VCLGIRGALLRAAARVALRAMRERRWSSVGFWLAPAAALAALAVGAVIGSLALPALAYSPPKAPASEQTHPRVHPTTAARHATFLVTLTARDDLGVRGVVQSDYSIQVQGGHPGCKTGSATVLTSAVKGQRLRVHLTAPGSGWCRGRYRGLVLFERGPYCPKPAPSKPPQPCPLFASQALDVGRFAFRVR
jgi:hypothetical protein